MPTPRSVYTQQIPEQSAFRYTAKLTKLDPAGEAPLAAADLASLTLTVYALDAALTIVNNLNAVNILNTGRGSIDANGLLVVVLDSADLALIDPAAATERHVMLIQGVYGARATRHEVEHTIVNLAKVS